MFTSRGVHRGGLGLGQQSRAVGGKGQGGAGFEPAHRKLPRKMLNYSKNHKYRYYGSKIPEISIQK
jgi:hypothetical protein